MKASAAPLLLDKNDNNMSDKLRSCCNKLNSSLEVLKISINKYETYKNIKNNKQLEIMESTDDRRD